VPILLSAQAVGEAIGWKLDVVIAERGVAFDVSHKGASLREPHREKVRSSALGAVLDRPETGEPADSVPRLACAEVALHNHTTSHLGPESGVTDASWKSAARAAVSVEVPADALCLSWIQVDFEQFAASALCWSTGAY